MMTSTQVKARFAAEGLSIAKWAKARGFKAYLVYRVLDGSCKAKRGQAHKIAVALGIKNEPKKLQYRPAVDAA